MPARNHRGRDFFGCDERSKGIDPPICFVLFGRDLSDTSEFARAGVVEQHFGLAEVLANGAKHSCYLRGIADVAPEFQHLGPALPYLARE